MFSEKFCHTKLGSGDGRPTIVDIFSRKVLTANQSATHNIKYLQAEDYCHILTTVRSMSLVFTRPTLTCWPGRCRPSRSCSSISSLGCYHTPFPPFPSSTERFPETSCRWLKKPTNKNEIPCNKINYTLIIFILYNKSEIIFGFPWPDSEKTDQEGFTFMKWSPSWIEEKLILTQMLPPVVSSGDRVKLLLSSCVPQHQSNLSPIVSSHHLFQEVHPNSLLVGGGEDALTEPPDQAGLPDSSVSDNDDLEVNVSRQCWLCKSSARLRPVVNSKLRKLSWPLWAVIRAKFSGLIIIFAEQCCNHRQ